MVHFPGFARTRLWIQRAVSRVYRDGFPHSEIPGSKPACGSPRLIAACHVLHRLLAPRHPPYALSSLTIKLTQRVVLVVHPERIGTRTKKRMDKLAFPQIALLEQNLQITSSRSFARARRVMPALFSCQRTFSPRPAECPNVIGTPRGFPSAGKQKTRRRAPGQTVLTTSGRLCAMLDCDLSCIRD